MTLISLAIVVAFVTSWAGTLGLFEVEIWWELATLITIMLLGHWLEMRSIAQARGALAALADLLPDTAERVTAGGTETVPLAALAVGDVVLVRPGARVPVDGTVDGGQRRRRRVDDHRRVPGRRQGAGRLGHRGHGRRRRLAAGPGHGDRRGDRAVGDHADGRRRPGVGLAGPGARRPGGRPPVLRRARPPARSRSSFWWLQGDPEGALVRTATVLVIACPHALGLAIPLVIAISTSLGARNGLLVKDRIALERARSSTWSSSTRPGR